MWGMQYSTTTTLEAQHKLLGLRFHCNAWKENVVRSWWLGWCLSYLKYEKDIFLFYSARITQFTGVFFLSRKLSHSRLVQLYGVCIQQKPLYIVTEFMENGCLLNYLRERKGTLRKALLLSVCQDICEGMAYLERSCYIHRDLVSRGTSPYVTALDWEGHGDHFRCFEECAFGFNLEHFKFMPFIVKG